MVGDSEDKSLIDKSYISNKKVDVKKLIENRLDESFKDIKLAYEKISEYSDKKEHLPKASEWILNDFYLIELKYVGIKLNLKKEKKIVLNTMENGILKGYPRIYGLALDLIYDTKGEIEEEKIIEFLDEFQEEEILTLEELSRFQTILSFGLIEYIRDIVLVILDKSNTWMCVNNMDLSVEENAQNIIENVNVLNPTIIESLVKKIKRTREGSKDLLESIDIKLNYIGESIKEIMEKEYMNQSKDNAILGYGIKSLRSISNMNWDIIINEVSRVEKMYLEDPSSIYINMEKSSKDYYKFKTQELADKLKVQEILVAEKALEFAQEEWNSAVRDKKAHIGYYLIDKGRKKLFEYFDIKEKNTSIFLNKYSYYYAPIIVLSVFLAAVFSRAVFNNDNIYWGILVFVLTIIPLMTIFSEIVNYIYLKKFEPKILPKLEYKTGIPKEDTTMVVIPALLTDENRVRELVEKLEVHYLSNKEENIFFALVGDFKDADTKTTDGDKKIVSTGLELINSLNKKYSKEKDLFYFFHRERLYSKTQDKWMGWEKKRGSLVELNDLLLGNKNTSFNIVSGDTSRLKIKYIITLDGDTKLPIGIAKRLIGTISHPLNKAIVDEEKNIVKEGYGIIQPRMTVDIESSNKNLFTRIFAGEGGIDPYSSGVSDIYQDLFGEGSFIGKGIYDLQVFQRCLKTTMPENTILSHDLLEGGYIRTGLATDIKLIDEYPEKYSAYIMREHRWVRGDWQIIRWLKNKTISTLSKWKIFDNMRRSSVPIALFLILFLGIVFIPGNAFMWIALYLITTLIPVITMAIEYIFNKRLKTANLNLNGNVILGYKSYLYHAVLYLMFLPYRALMMIDAIVRTLYRMFFSKKNLLEWTTAFDMEKKVKDDMVSYYKRMNINIITAISLIIFTYLFRFENLIGSIILGLLWIIGPLVAYAISKKEKKIVEVDEEDLKTLKDIGKKTWDYYAELINKSNNYLPPDNYQEYPDNGAVNRTSPTNIGFYLLAILSSKDLGFISTNKMIELVSLTINTLEKMEKWQGNLYNWYDINTLEPLRPIFVSTVDSGNFVSYLIVLKEGLKECLPESDLITTETESLIRRIENLIENTKFAGLYDEHKDLFYIGYNVDENKPADNHYDLLASEARVASYIAISRKEIPLEHWNRMGRALVMENGYITLASWSATMFEYLMPSIILKNYKNTLLDETYRTVVEEQKKYGENKNIPWGISESGFFAFDSKLNYQYKAFGLASLGFKRGLKDELVVSPYSTFLALKFDYKAVLENIKKLEAEGLKGHYGFYEAIDYTTSRLPKGQEKGIVKSYMSHHQGMILSSINNFINDDILVERFHRDSKMKTGEFLLQEKIPTFTILYDKKAELTKLDILVEEDEVYSERSCNYECIKCQLLSSGSYSLMINNRGEGFSKNNDLFINRWRSDHLSTPYGQFIYINDLKNKKIWSTTYAPTYEKADEYKVTFLNYKANFYRRDGDIETEMDVFLLPEELGEIREVSITNNAKEEALIEITSYFEVLAQNLQSDLAHPSFSNLFIQTEALEEQESILAHRRKREEDSKDNYIVHGIRSVAESAEKFQYDTSKEEFINRGNSFKRPKAVSNIGQSDTVGTVLDPIMSCSKKLKIQKGEKIKVYYITALTESKDEAIKILDKYKDVNNIAMAKKLSKTKSSIEIGYLELKHSNINLCEDILPEIIYAQRNNKIKYKEILKLNKKGQAALWGQGISGDNPIVLVTIDSMEGIYNLTKLIDAHEYWSYRGLVIDLVILTQEEASYYEPLVENIKEIIYKSKAGVVDHLGEIVIVNRNNIESEDIPILYKWARLIIKAEDDLIDEEEREEIPFKKFNKVEKHEDTSDNTFLELDYFNDYGGFSKDGKEYIIKLKKDLNTPLPWSNVIANKDFGFLVTESGTGFTWADNSRENKLTPWYNDPIIDVPGEIIYVRDDDTGEIWNITPKPNRNGKDYIITHGLGYSKFNHDSFGLKQSLTVFVPKKDRIKINLVELENTRKEKVNLTLFYYIRPVLGVTDEKTENLLETEIKENIFMVKNSTNVEFKNSTMFIGTSEVIKSYTGDRAEFIGRAPNYENPEGVKRERLSNRVGIGYNPCSVIEVKLEIAADEKKELTFLLGEEKSFEEGQKLINKYKDLKTSKLALEEVKEFWEKKTNLISIKTPDNAMNLMMNSWLIYQTISCRIWARTGFYQVGGAYGARDQMQDVSNVLYQFPKEAEKQIIRNCKHQFIEGDLQHWWHPEYDSEVHKGIRSKCSDDLLWLPFAVAEYIEKTGRDEILKEKTFFIESPILKETEMERYETPTKSDEIGSVYEHCLRAIDHSLHFGERGLPLIGSGDWNDGMNKVGYKGQGESVWLAWFLATVLDKFIPLCEKLEDFERVDKYKKTILLLKDAIESIAWDGNWYKRAFFDDGTPIGSEENAECTIDSIAQSWSVISKLGNLERSKTALESVEKHLVNQKQGIISLLTPPFDSMKLNPGYIKSYVPGVRENGGQYTHAAAWLIKAFAMLKEGDKAYNLFNLINPINHSRTAIECDKYKVEPYVVSADVYTNHQHIGRGGWTWYTGSAGWLYNVGLEDILGFKVLEDKLFMNPCIPKSWEGFSIKYTYKNTVYNIEVENIEAENTDVKNTTNSTIKLDGNRVKDYVLLEDDGVEHFVVVELIN